MDLCNECGSAEVIKARSEYVCTCCGLVKKGGLLELGYEYEQGNSVQTVVDREIEVLVYSLGYEESKCIDVETLYKRYLKEYGKMFVMKKKVNCVCIVDIFDKEWTFQRICESL